jgi:hypothetical protein
MMHVGRRGFLALTAAATAASSFWSRRAVAGVKAVHFDGMTYLQNNGLPTMPSSSSEFVLSFWYNGVCPNKSRTQNIILTQLDEYTIVLACYITPSTSGNAVLFIDAIDTARRSNGFRKSIVVPCADGWHHIIFYLNTQAASCHVYVDDSAATVHNSSKAGSGFNVDCAGTWRVSYRPYTTPAPYTGDLAELFFLAGTYVDITDPAVRAKFIDPDTLLPIAIDAGGLWPFFDSLGVAPQIWLSGNENLFPRNYPGWSATLVQQFDSDPTSQFAVIGNLTTAAADPFGQSR